MTMPASGRYVIFSRESGARSMYPVTPTSLPTRRPLVPRRYNDFVASRDAGSHCSVSKLLLLIIAIVVVYFVLTSSARKRRPRSAPPPVEPMVPCAHCGINVPRSEALGAAGRFFCSEEHRRLGAG